MRTAVQVTFRAAFVLMPGRDPVAGPAAEWPTYRRHRSAEQTSYPMPRGLFPPLSSDNSGHPGPGGAGAHKSGASGSCEHWSWSAGRLIELRRVWVGASLRNLSRPAANRGEQLRYPQLAGEVVPGERPRGLCGSGKVLRPRLAKSLWGRTDFRSPKISCTV